jgi:flagellin
MRVNTNVNSLVAMRNLSTANSQVSDSMGKLSTGFRINRAADDAAGLGIANQLRANTRSLVQAGRNAEQANSVLQIAEGSTSTIQKMLERMKELATQAASDTVDTGGRGRLQTEFNALVEEIDRTVETTKFQGTKLLDGGDAGAATRAFSFLVSSSESYGSHDNVSVALSSLRSSVLGMRQAGATAAAGSGITFSGEANATLDALIRFGGGHGLIAATSSISGGTGDAPSLSATSANTTAEQVRVRYETSAVAQAGLANTGTITAGSAAAATTTGNMLLRVDGGALEYWDGSAWESAVADHGATFAGGNGEITFNGVKFSLADAVNGDTFEIATSANWQQSRFDTGTESWSAFSNIGGNTITVGTDVIVDISGASRIAGQWEIVTTPEQAPVADRWQVSTNDGETWVSTSGANEHSMGNVTFDLTDAVRGPEFAIGTSENNGQALSVGSVGGAQTTLARIDSAIRMVNEQLGDIGAAQNRIDYATQNVKTAIVNQTAAESVIRDLDMADEMTKFSKNNIISQAATAMLAQANQSSQGVLQLLRG